MMLPPVSSPLPPPVNTALAPAPDGNDRLMALARDLEASFLAEMLAHAGLGESRGGFGGGAGEEQFASMLRSEQARALAERGGIGLAETIFQSLVSRTETSVDGAS